MLSKSPKGEAARMNFMPRTELGQTLCTGTVLPFKYEWRLKQNITRVYGPEDLLTQMYLQY